MKLSVVMPVKGNIEYTRLAVKTLKETAECELIIIDNGSKELEVVELMVMADIYQRNTGKGVHALWNQGILAATGEYVAVINNDVVFAPGWAEPLIDAISDDVGLASPYHTDYVLPADFPAGASRHINTIANLPMLGCCFMAKRQTFIDVGPFPEALKYWYGEQWLIAELKKRGQITEEIAESYIHHFVSKTANDTATPGFSQDARRDKIKYRGMKTR